ncbi:MAG: LysM peptidoglycan-binding domain-containing protein [Verrucomicrobiota bacterium]
MGRLKLVFVFLSFLILVAAAVFVAYYWEHVVKPDLAIEQELKKEVNVKARAAPDLGVREFEQVVELLKKGESMTARERLYYLMEYYPDSSVLPEARRIVGEINTDLLISKIPLEGKSEYVVKSGDALAAIARHHQTTIDYIMRANGRTTSIIHPGDRLWVFPLNFEVVIDQSEKVIRLELKGLFFKEYPVIKFALPPQVKAPVKAEIKDRVAWFEEKRVLFNNKNYLKSKKWLQTSRRGLIIRAYDGSDKAEEEFGILVAPEDLQEMFTLFRVSTSIRLVE